MEIEVAKKILLDNVKPICSVELVPLSNLCGRVLAEEIVAPFSVPSFPKSAMDGYAVNAKDVLGATNDKPVKLKVKEELLAGDYKEVEYEDNTAIRVMTGAYIPEGYNAVVMQEKTDYGMDEVLVYDGVKPLVNYCQVGEDIEEGTLVAPKGSVINRTLVGVLASLGIQQVNVFEKVKVGILATGSELVNVQDSLSPGKIYNSISNMIEADLKRFGIECDSRICGDEIEVIEDNLNDLIGSYNLVITTGGVSVGKKDLLPEVLDNIGATKLFGRVNIKPGTPTIGSVKKNTVIVSLSGNPYAALCNFDYYCWDVLAKLSGNDSYKLVEGKAFLGEDYSKKESKRRLLRGRFEKGIVSIEKNNKSSVIGNMAECNCYVEIKENTEYEKEDLVNIYYFK